MGDVIRKTRSVCPVCLENIGAELVRRPDGAVYMEKSCERHGFFKVPVWRGDMDFSLWSSSGEALKDGEGLRCPRDCGLCEEHKIGSCCVLLEVTGRCSLRCRFCFANGGDAAEDTPLRQLKHAIDDITAACGSPLLQLSGGEPTLRDDLPELIRYAKDNGCAYVQVNTNGIRLAEDPGYVRRLKDAGLDIVFLQFDGTDDRVYKELRNAPLLETKLAAIDECGRNGLGVTLVPTVVPGVNGDCLGDIIEFARSRIPVVRGVHFQPVSYFGRYPAQPGEDDRLTLDRLMTEISSQAGIPVSAFMPSRCDHPLCGFHASFMQMRDGTLKPLSSFSASSPKRGCERDNREYVAKHWIMPPPEAEPPEVFGEEMDFDTFLYNVRHRSLTLSAMAFQDAMNLNIERLCRCSLHVYDGGKIKPFCAKYLSAVNLNPCSE